MRARWVLAASAVAVVAIAAGGHYWRHRARPTGRPQVKQVEPPPTGEVTLSGRIRAQHVVAVGATVDGNIEAFLADVGQEVAQGQLLARISNQGLETGREMAQVALDNATSRATKTEAQLNAARLEASRAQADAARARADLDRAERTWSRQKMLHGEGATPRMAYEKASADYDAATADAENLEKLAKLADSRIEALQDELRNARKIVDDKQKQFEDASGALTAAALVSPIDGIVVGRKGEVGKSAREPGSELFQIASDLLALEVVLEPEPPVLARLKAGQPAVVSVSEMSNDLIPAKVKEVKDSLVSVEFASPNPAIKPGMIAEARIRIE